LRNKIPPGGQCQPPNYTQEEERKELLKEALKAELRSAAKDLLVEIALAERKLFCEQNEDVCNGYYSRGLDGLFGKIDVRVPRTRDKVFRPFFLEPYKRTSYELEDLVVAMYQGGCFTRDISRTVGALIDGKYSANWISNLKLLGEGTTAPPALPPLQSLYL